jgi:hypothetical protein
MSFALLSANNQSASFGVHLRLKKRLIDMNLCCLGVLGTSAVQFPFLAVSAAWTVFAMSAAPATFGWILSGNISGLPLSAV